MAFDRRFGARKSLTKRTNHDTAVSGQGSILFDRDENQRLFDALGPQFLCITAGFAYLYVLQDSTWHRVRFGVCALAKDRQTGQCMLKFFNFLFVEQWSQVVSRDFEISMSPDFWRFQVDKQWYATRFVSSTEAVVLASVLNQHGTDPPTMPPVRSTSLEQQNRIRSRSIEPSNSVQNGRDKSLERQAKTRRSIRKLNKKDIGQPFDARHVTHAGSEKFDELKSIITSANDLSKTNSCIACPAETSKSVSPRLSSRLIFPPKRPPPPVPACSPVLSPTAPPITPPSSPLDSTDERPAAISKSKSMDCTNERIKIGETELEVDGGYAVIVKKTDGKLVNRAAPDENGNAKMDIDLIGKDFDSMSREELTKVANLLKSKLQKFEKYQREQDPSRNINDEMAAFNRMYPMLPGGHAPKIPAGLYPRLSVVHDQPENDPKMDGDDPEVNGDEPKVDGDDSKSTGQDPKPTEQDSKPSTLELSSQSIAKSDPSASTAENLQSPTGQTSKAPARPKPPVGRTPTPFTQVELQLPAEQNLQHLTKQRPKHPPKRPPQPKLQQLNNRILAPSQAQNQKPVPPPRFNGPLKTPPTTPSQALPKQISGAVEMFESFQQK